MAAAPGRCDSSCTKQAPWLTHGRPSPFLAAATFGVDDVPAFRELFDTAPIDKAFSFAPLPEDSECAARCAKLKASGKKQELPPVSPAEKHSVSLAGAEPWTDNKFGSARTITGADLPALKELAGSGATLTLETLQPCSLQVGRGQRAGGSMHGRPGQDVRRAVDRPPHSSLPNPAVTSSPSSCPTRRCPTCTPTPLR